MRARIAASVILAAGILLGTSACNLVAPQATTKHYDASDGVSADIGDLDVRNAILISETGTDGNLVVTVVNKAGTAARLAVQFESKGKKITQHVVLAGDSTTVLGEPDGEVVILRGIDSIPGSLVPVFFQYGEASGKELLIPVLDGGLPEYSELLPADVEN
ncbi:hypothetical protein [Luethyella okanaganae]|uniref:DNA modification methylase n=1 Tax=Luethyella okanaganae TaxID=69372 RepID=A0ABW1VJP9_9MICO